MKKTYDFSDVNIVPKHTELHSRSQPNLIVKYITKYSNKCFSGLPIIVSNMDYIGTVKMANALGPHNIWVALHKFEKIEHIRSNAFITFGMSDNDCESILSLSKSDLSNMPICLDVANGYMYKFLDHIKYVRDLFPNNIIMAGNICTPEGAENIIRAGADIVKAGIGGGSFCLTRNKTGIGIKQFTVAQECGQAANELNALCCSDGGIRDIGDICKALAAGSHLVMAGSLFAGYDENDVDNWEYPLLSGLEEHKYMKFYGMSSRAANDKYFNGLKEYRTSEGHEEYIKYKGPISSLVQDIKGGMSSCCTYTNTLNIENLKKNCDFVC